MLVATIDGLVSTELDALVKVLESDGYVCLPSSRVSLDACHDTIESHRTTPIIIYGEKSMDLPFDDCAQIWLSCGPTIENDVRHAQALHHWHCWENKTLTFAEFLYTSQKIEIDDKHQDQFRQALIRRGRAMSYGYKFMTFPQALSFLAGALALKRVESMGLEDNASRLVLRHVTK